MEKKMKRGSESGMVWEKRKSTLHVAEGEAGTFYIQESRRGGLRRFWVKYRSKKVGGKNFNMPPSGSLIAAKTAAEDNQYWEDAKAVNDSKKDVPLHAFAPKREAKRWDMRD